jgi:hypothetical protein
MTFRPRDNPGHLYFIVGPGRLEQADAQRRKAQGRKWHVGQRYLSCWVALPGHSAGCGIPVAGITVLTAMELPFCFDERVEGGADRLLPHRCCWRSR